MGEHTPTPWSVVGYGASTQIVEASREHMRVCFMTSDGIPRSNAEFIVKAVNCHDHLVKALEASCGYLLNAKIDLETGRTKATAIKTIEGGLLRAKAVLAIVEHTREDGR